MNPPVAEMHLRAERAPFVMLPRWLLYHPDVGEGAKFLYCVLHDLVAGRQGPTRPVTRAQLADSCGVAVDTIDRRLAQLVAVGAVEKQAQIRAGGQTANVYQVWLTPPAGIHRTPPATSNDKPPPADEASDHPDDNPHGQPSMAPHNVATPVDNRSRISAAPVEGSANGLVNRSRDFAAPPPGPRPEPHSCGAPSRDFAAPSVFEEVNEEVPPQPPRSAGGPDAPHDPTDQAAARRTTGLNPRALGANPRAEADRAEESRQRQLAERREAELAAAAANRRAAEEEARVDAAAFEAEALALSAVLDDDRLAAVVALSTEGVAGPLARSPFAAARAVVAWCRAAASRHPGPLPAAIDVALAARWRPTPEGEEAGEPLDLASPSLGMPPLRERLAALVRPAATGEEPG